MFLAVVALVALFFFARILVQRYSTNPALSNAVGWAVAGAFLAGIAGGWLLFADNQAPASQAPAAAAPAAIAPAPVAALPLPALLPEKSGYSFVARYSSGSINSHATAATPTGMGVFSSGWPYGSTSIDSLIVLAGFRYSYPNVPIKPKDSLTFVAAAPYPIGRGAVAAVDIVDRGQTYHVFAHDELQALPTGPRWERVTIPLQRFAGRNVTIVFSAETRGDPTAAWIVYGNAEIAQNVKAD